jgi:hypothetical protein
MTTSVQVFDGNPPALAKVGPFQRFNVRCFKCGALRVILIGELNEESGEFTIMHSVSSRKTYCCELPFQEFEKINSG